MYVAIDVGGSAMKYGLLSSEYRFLDKGMTQERMSSPEEFAACVRRIYDRYAGCAKAVTVSYCGELDPENGYAYSGGTLSFNTNVELRILLQEALPVPVMIENDGNCAAMAEWSNGCLKGCQNAVTYVLGSGVATGLILDGKIYRGTHFSAGFASGMITSLREVMDRGEVFGHMVAGTSGDAYRPGNIMAAAIGYLGLTAPYAYAKGVPQGSVSGEDFFAALHAEDRTANLIMDEFCLALAGFLYNTQCLLDVEAIAIGGGISQQPELLKRTQQHLDEHYAALSEMGVITHAPKLLCCHYRADANLIGALAFYLAAHRN